MTSMKACANCGQFYHADAEICACGYVFSTDPDSEVIAPSPIKDMAGNLKIGGGLWFALGFCAVGYSFFAKTSVSTPSYNVLGISSSGMDVVNVGLLQQQMMVLHSGIAAALIGIIMIVGAYVIEAIISR